MTQSNSHRPLYFCMPFSNNHYALQLVKKGFHGKRRWCAANARLMTLLILLTNAKLSKHGPRIFGTNK